MTSVLEQVQHDLQVHDDFSQMEMNVPWPSNMFPLSQNRRSQATGLLWNISAYTVVGLSSYWCYRLLRLYGWEGALRYIWEGDPLPHDVRKCINTLKNVSQGLGDQEEVILSMEEGLERARLDTIDESGQAAVLDCWRMSLPLAQRDIRGNLAKTSATLDKLASEIDQVPTNDSVRQEKKELSCRVVALMARVDVLIDFFKQATNERFKI